MICFSGASGKLSQGNIDKMDSRNNIELAELILELIRGTLSQQRSEYLFQRLKEDAEARRYYIEFMAIHAGLQGHVDNKESRASGMSEVSELDSALLALAENEKTAMAVDIPEPQEAPLPVRPLETVRQEIRQKRKISKLDVYTIAVSVAAVFFLVALVLLKPVGGRPVAVLTDTSNAGWEGIESHFYVGNSLYRGPMTLKSGFAEITFKKGAKVIVQAPVEFELESDNSMLLYSGRLSAIVPETAIGFTVQTSDAAVIDYGTEFGVVSSQDGKTETHVFTGEVEMQTLGVGELKLTKRLRGGQRGVVTDGELDVSRLSGSSRGFVRDMDEIRFGNGFLGRNLVVNGDFEANQDVPEIGNQDFNYLGHNLDIVGWQDETLATVVPYNAMTGYYFQYQQVDKVPLPSNRGRFFFCGVESGIVWQEVNISALSEQINTGDVRYDLSAWLGGWAEHLDNAVITVHFLDWSDFEVGKAKIGPLTMEERDAQMLFSKRTAAGSVPVGTQLVRLEIETFEGTGAADAYIDNLSLILNIN